MRNRFDGNGNPDIKVVVAEYRDAMRKRIRWVGPAIGGLLLLALAWTGVFTVNPGEVGIVRTFGKAGTAESDWKGPGLHVIIPLVQQVDIVDLQKVRRAEIGFRSTPNGPKIVPAEAQMLTGDENMVEVEMIVQYRVTSPVAYLFKLKDPEQSLHIAAEVALRDVVGQMKVASSMEELQTSEGRGPPMKGAKKPQDKEDKEDDDAKEPAKPEAGDREPVDPETDILTKGRERAQVRTKELLQELMTLYESGITITVVKLLPVDVPEEVKDAFHDVVRAREEREQKINKALAYREDRIPRARGEKQKIIREAQAYKRERVLRSEGEAARFKAILAEYRKARSVTRERLHLETMERILQKVPKKVFIDKDVAKNALPLLPLTGGMLGGGKKGGG